MNIEPSAKKKPDVFNRFLGGLIHPIIKPDVPTLTGSRLDPSNLNTPNPSASNANTSAAGPSSHTRSHVNDAAHHTNTNSNSNPWEVFALRYACGRRSPPITMQIPPLNVIVPALSSSALPPRPSLRGRRPAWPPPPLLSSFALSPPLPLTSPPAGET
ncbi:hypothetical protein D9615_000995 [Tricholomella constricta]|uniref:Uncharacterized protein n=1 Tax=Tricholomella constricta TaxID=117010 RepID=A0A8H5HKM9_9AGAR|nr:hypothetical protein D9615_000995 [Tricholomella constricta]